jgi:hypothetical protein
MLMIWDRAAMISDRTVKQLTQRHAKAQQAAFALSGSNIARCIIIRKDSCAWEVQRENVHDKERRMVVDFQDDRRELHVIRIRS